MNAATNNTPAIIRTERGLTIAGTRITLYEIMDCLLAHWPNKLIRNRMNLTDVQLEQALAYINSNRSDFEKEYQEVVRASEEIREYWENRNRERFEAIAQQANKKDLDAVRKKIQTRKKQLGLLYDCAR